MPSSSSADAGRERSYDMPEHPLCARPLLTALAAAPESGDRARLSAAEKRLLSEDASLCVKLMCGSKDADGRLADQIIKQMPAKNKLNGVEAALALLCGRGPRPPIMESLGVLAPTAAWDVRRNKHAQVDDRLRQLVELEDPTARRSDVPPPFPIGVFQHHPLKISARCLHLYASDDHRVGVSTR